MEGKRWPLLGLIVVALLLVGFASLKQLEVLALYPRPVPDTSFEVAPGALWKLKTDGALVHAVHLKAQGHKPTIVTFHGNGHQVGAMLPWLSLLDERGFGALLVEYPGYGLSHLGTPDEEAIYQDAEFAIKHLIATQGVANSDIVLLGESLGTGVATELATRGYGARVVLLSPFTSVAALAELHAPWLPFPSLLSNKYDNLSKATSLLQSTLIIHGTEDSLVPAAMAKQLATKLRDAHLVLWQGVAHGGMIAHHGAEVLDALESQSRLPPAD